MESLNTTFLERFRYNPVTGLVLCHRTKKGDRKTKPDGYKVIGTSYEGKMYYMREHRFAFLSMKGEIPKCVDHINGIKNDNRWENLRTATRSENNRNVGLRADNITGVKGVYIRKNTGKYQAQIMVKGKNKYVGVFETLEEADKAIKSIRILEHKEFTNDG